MLYEKNSDEWGNTGKDAREGKEELLKRNSSGCMAAIRDALKRCGKRVRRKNAARQVPRHVPRQIQQREENRPQNFLFKRRRSRGLADFRNTPNWVLLKLFLKKPAVFGSLSVQRPISGLFQFRRHFLPGAFPVGKGEISQCVADVGDVVGKH